MFHSSRFRFYSLGAILSTLSVTGPVWATELDVLGVSNECERRMTLRLSAPAAKRFTADQVTKVADVQRRNLACSAMKQFIIKGYVGDTLVYQGITRAPRWKLRSTPVLSGANAIAAATPPRLDPAKLPPVDSYRLLPMPERGTACATRMYFNLAGPAPMTNDNRRFVDALSGLAELASSACPEVTMLSLKPPPGSGSRFSFFSLRQQDEWLPGPVYAKLRGSRQNVVMAQSQAMKARPKPTDTTPNPLKDRGFYAADELGRGIDFTLYRAWLEERDFSRRSTLVVVHDPRPAEAAIVPIRYTSARGQYLIGQAFIDDVNDTLKDAGEHVISVVNLMHYVQGVTSPMAPARSSSNPPIIERPLFESSYDIKKASIYTIPQLGAARLLNLVSDPQGNGVLNRRPIFENEAPGADQVLTSKELTGG